MDHEPQWESLNAEETDALVPNSPDTNGGPDTTMANGGGTTNGTSGHHSDDHSDSDAELGDQPVSMTLRSLAPFSSISEVTLNKLDLGDLQLNRDEFDV